MTAGLFKLKIDTAQIESNFFKLRMKSLKICWTKKLLQNVVCLSICYNLKDDENILFLSDLLLKDQTTLGHTIYNRIYNFKCSFLMIFNHQFFFFFNVGPP